jgi:hypothetical protein
MCIPSPCKSTPLSYYNYTGYPMYVWRGKSPSPREKGCRHHLLVRASPEVLPHNTNVSIVQTYLTWATAAQRVSSIPACPRMFNTYTIQDKCGIQPYAKRQSREANTNEDEQQRTQQTLANRPTKPTTQSKPQTGPTDPSTTHKPPLAKTPFTDSRMMSDGTYF